MTKRAFPFLAAAAALAAAPAVAAEPAPFDLAGPALRVTVARGGVTLPIGQVPNLAEGDRLTIRADLPDDQAAHYLLVTAFLRGATNPPPEKWFAQAETWTKKGKQGLVLTVPPGAQQVVVFLAPSTGGDFATLRNTVRGRPGAFVRASQDLNQATLDRSRLDAFVGVLGRTPPDRVATVAPQLATSLAIKLNPDCLQKMPALQSSCLMQNQESMLLNDGHSSLISDTLTGQGADLALQLSATPQGGLGYYSPYIAAIRDIIGIFGSFHTAKYQYLPALKIERGDRIAMLLNGAPSFHNPKSVLVTALPAIGPAQPPPLRLAEDAPVCAGSSATRVPMSGAPLVFSTAYAHDLRLEGKGSDGKPVWLPAVADAASNALVVDDRDGRLRTASAATVRGRWGFDGFDGPAVTLQAATPGRWQIDENDRRALVVGRTGKVALTGGAAACVQGVELRPASGPARPVEWSVAGPHTLALTPALADVAAGDATFLVHEAGLAEPEAIAARTYAEPSALAGFTLHAGDRVGSLRGSRLDQVASLTLDGVPFTPGALTRDDGGDALEMTSAAPPPDAPQGQARTARVAFRDGRTATTRVTIDAARPVLAIVARSVNAAPETAPVLLRLTQADAVPRGATLTFSLRMQPGPWRGDETVEIASGSGATARLAIGRGLALQDSGTAIATLDSAAAFDRPAFGPLRVRVMRAGVASDWQPLATLVRKPALHQLTCAADDPVKCQLDGADLYLIQAVAADAAFTRAMPVPDGYTGSVVAVPRPTESRLYVRLRDDPATVNEIVGAKGTLP